MLPALPASIVMEPLGASHVILHVTAAGELLHLVSNVQLIINPQEPAVLPVRLGSSALQAIFPAFLAMHRAMDALAVSTRASNVPLTTSQVVVLARHAQQVRSHLLVIAPANHVMQNVQVALVLLPLASSAIKISMQQEEIVTPVLSGSSVLLAIQVVPLAMHHAMAVMERKQTVLSVLSIMHLLVVLVVLHASTVLGKPWEMVVAHNVMQNVMAALEQLEPVCNVQSTTMLRVATVWPVPTVNSVPWVIHHVCPATQAVMAATAHSLLAMLVQSTMSLVVHLVLPVPAANIVPLGILLVSHATQNVRVVLALQVLAFTATSTTTLLVVVTVLHVLMANSAP